MPVYTFGESRFLRSGGSENPMRPLERLRQDIIPNYVVPSIIALGVAFVLAFQVMSIAPRQRDNSRTFESFANGLQKYYGLRAAWKTRLFSNYLAEKVMDFFRGIRPAHFSFFSVENPFQLGLAFWTVLWLLLISAMYILFMRKRAILYILGTSAALSFGYLRALSERVFPWDMTALFFFTLFVLLFDRKKYYWLLVILPLGMGFKETVGILSLGFLFTDFPWRKRLILFGASVALCAAVKIGIDLFVREPVPFFTMETGGRRFLSLGYFRQNIRLLGTAVPLLVNSGTLLGFLLLPSVNRTMLALKTIAIAFILGNFMFGGITEYRIWFEMIPLAMYGFDLTLYGNPITERVAEEADQRSLEPGPVTTAPV
jgi:hypothetical protein